MKSKKICVGYIERNVSYDCRKRKHENNELCSRNVTACLQ